MSRYDGDEYNRGMAMLILTRKVGESVMVGDDITVTVLGVKGNQVRVGVKAPRDVSVHRKEIYERINNVSLDKQVEHSEKNAAASTVEYDYQEFSITNSEVEEDILS